MTVGAPVDPHELEPISKSPEEDNAAGSRSQSVRMALTFPSADSSAVALALSSLLDDDRLRADHPSSARVHHARHTRSEVARSYLRVLESAARFASRATHADQSLHE
jgi:hypothetical protein